MTATQDSSYFFLNFYELESRSHLFQIKRTDIVTLGTSSGVTIQYSHDSVKPKHLELSLGTNNEVRITFLAEGKVNGHTVSLNQSMELKLSDVISIGDINFKLEKHSPQKYTVDTFLDFRSVSDPKPISSLVDLWLVNVLPKQIDRTGESLNTLIQRLVGLAENYKESGLESDKTTFEKEVESKEPLDLFFVVKVLHLYIHLADIDQAVKSSQADDEMDGSLGHMPFVLKTMTEYLSEHGENNFATWINSIQLRLVSTVHPNETERSANLRHYESLFSQYHEWKGLLLSIKYLPHGSSVYRARREQMNQLRRVMKAEIEAIWQSDQTRHHPIKVETEAARILERYNVVIGSYPSWVKFIKHLCTEAFWRYQGSKKLNDPQWMEAYNSKRLRWCWYITISKTGSEAERVPMLYALKYAFKQCNDPLERIRIQTPIIVFGTWKGGDRDGNPFVIASFTNRTFITHKEFILEYYIKIVKNLMYKLTSSTGQIKPTNDLVERHKKYAEIFPYIEGIRTEQYHNMLRYMEEMLVNTLARLKFAVKRTGPTIKPLLGQTSPGPTGYKNAAGFLSDVKCLFDSLVANKAKAQARSLLQDLYILVDTFGFHMMSVDFRQLSTKNFRTLQEYLNGIGLISSGDFAAMSEKEKIGKILDFLKKEDVTLNPQLIEELSPTSRDTLQTLIIMADAIKMEEKAVGKFIISMCSSVSDFLVIYALLKLAGIVKVKDGKIIQCPCDVTGLFETIDDLVQAPKTINSLLEIDLIRDCIYERRGGLLTVMLGYSDSVRDGSSLASDAQINSTSLKLVEIQDQMNAKYYNKGKFELVFYRGRGDTISRGYGGRIDTTIRAQVITSTKEDHTEQNRYLRNYMSGPSTTAHFHRLYSSHIAAVTQKPHPDTQLYQNYMDFFGKLSQLKWSELVRDHPIHRPHVAGMGTTFFQYLKTHTILPHLPKSYFASRPVARELDCNIDSIRAIPFTMVLAQTRDFCVAYYGCGTAFNQGVAYLSSPSDTARQLGAIYWKHILKNDHTLTAAFQKVVSTPDSIENPTDDPLVILLRSEKIMVPEILETLVDEILEAVVLQFPSSEEGIKHIAGLLLHLKKHNETPLQIIRKMYQNYRPFQFSIDNKGAAVTLHDKRIVDMYTAGASAEERQMLENIEAETQLTEKWVLEISQLSSPKKILKDVSNPRLFLLHKIQSHFLKLYSCLGAGKEKSTLRNELENYIQMTILAISEEKRVEQWTVDEVVQWALTIEGIDQTDAEILRKQRVNGKALLKVDNISLERWGIPGGSALNLCDEITKLKGEVREGDEVALLRKRVIEQDERISSLEEVDMALDLYLTSTSYSKSSNFQNVQKLLEGINLPKERGIRKKHKQKAKK